jgi:hypothetical protein
MTLITMPTGRPSYVQQLASRVGASWHTIEQARAETIRQRERLAHCAASLITSDTSLVVFGAIARGEWTSQSDVDWVLLIDGQSVPEHKLQETEIARALVTDGFTKPGSSGIFGRMVGSHDLVHTIGGEDDLNSNTTRRILLLLESCPIGNREAYDRVRLQIVKRYLLDDRGLTHGSTGTRIPRFLLNDLTRYWRTVTVDFVYKQSADGDKKWALRNAKLRMSRKLIFASGLARVFLCALDPDAHEAQEELRQSRTVSNLTAYFTEQLTLTPLEVLAKFCETLQIDAATVDQIFGNYDRFLAILNDPSKRDDLARATSHEDLRQSSAWADIRDISHPFHAGLVNLFLRNHPELAQLTMEYGVF